MKVEIIFFQETKASFWQGLSQQGISGSRTQSDPQAQKNRDYFFHFSSRIFII
jgi:hypothetical protein